MRSMSLRPFFGTTTGESNRDPMYRYHSVHLHHFHLPWFPKNLLAFRDVEGTVSH